MLQGMEWRRERHLTPLLPFDVRATLSLVPVLLPSPTMAKDPAKAKPPAYKAFEDFTRKLVRVPKSEIDAERAKAKRDKT